MVSSAANASAESHYLRSSYRESLVEHLFVGGLLRHFWCKGVFDVEVLKPQVDDAGYDLVLDSNGVIRHVQLKAKVRGSRTPVLLNVRLAQKPSGCVITVVFDRESVDPQTFEYLWFGSPPGQLLPEKWRGLAVAHTTKADMAGVKKERPNIRSLPYSFFEGPLTLEKLAQRLFDRT